ncbi:hypothetical protein A3F37_04290 [Candidatus Saccharibacteria bacterium RIFCSPHIGHO2_12_FULL_41_12]|nr:MAG: hypothetical protein A3F37_04290 [Candidatus Saccharibacteria bacterium RIFCSPHIGHO2_12_FULL_41_12]
MNNKRSDNLPNSTTVYLLKALIPYSKPNLKFSFARREFFKDLAKISRKKEKSLKNAYYRMIAQGLIAIDHAGIPRLTQKGKNKAQIYEPKKLAGEAKLMITFDIPETQRYKRDRLRQILRELYFEQAQKSVWTTKYDFREYLLAEIKESNLEDYVKIYECNELN